MPYVEIKLCDNFKISKLTCCPKKSSSFTDEDFKLIKAKQKKYHNLIPRKEDYIFLKVLYSGEIIAAVGKLLDAFHLKKEDLINKNLEDVSKCQVLFSDYIEPLFYSCLEKELAYQFDFKIKQKHYSCSIYPCSIPEEISSVDIVIRPSHNTEIENNTDKFALV